MPPLYTFAKALFGFVRFKSAHIARVYTTVLSICLVLLVVTSQSAFADNSKKASGKSKKAVPAVIKYGSLGSGAAEVAVTALGRPANSTSTSAKVKLASDTSRKESRIIFARATADVFTVRIDLVADEANLELGMYNMLGKKMADVYRGPATRGEHEYTMPISELPEGVYICILQASNTRRAEKFYLSR